MQPLIFGEGFEYVVIRKGNFIIYAIFLFVTPTENFFDFSIIKLY